MNFFERFKRNKTLHDYKVIYKHPHHENNEIILFKTSYEKWGAASVDGKVIVEPEYEVVGYHENKKLFLAKNRNSGKTIHFFFDINGSLITKIDGYNTVGVDEDGNIIITTYSPLKYGLLNDLFVESVKPVWDNIISIAGGLLKARKSNSWGIIDQKGNEVLTPGCKQILGRFDKSGAVACEMDNGFFLVNKQGETIKKLPYKYILPYNTNSGGIRLHQKFKAVVSDKESRDNLYADEMYEYVGKWGILNDDFSELIPPKYEYIDFFRNPNYFKVVEGELEFDNSGDYMAVTKGLLGVIDSRSNFIITPEYSYICEIFDGLWAVNKGGGVYYDDGYQEDHWAVKGGKWGVIDSKSNLIVPVKYDTIMTIWGKTDYIFAQNGSLHFDRKKHYDVYTPTGENSHLL